MSMLLQKYKIFLNNTNLRLDISHKHLHPINFKHTHIAKLSDFVRIQQFHATSTLVEVVAKRDAAVPALDFPTARPQFDVHRFRRLEHLFKRRDMNRASHYEKLLLYVLLKIRLGVAPTITCCFFTCFQLNFTRFVALERSESSLSTSVISTFVPFGKS